MRDLEVLARPNKDVIFQPVRDAVDATRVFLTAVQLIKVSETKPRLRCYPAGPALCETENAQS